MNKMQDYLSKIEPKTKKALENALDVIRKNVPSEMTVDDITNRTNNALINYDEATFMHGYFRACAHMLPEYADIFYTAAIIMIHFKYYHYDEGGYNHE